MSNSDLEIENWNPMAEDYSSSKFNSYGNDQSQSLVDPCSLYIKSIPAYLTQDAFQSMFSEYGRIVRYKVYPTRQNMILTCGLVSFETELEAKAAIHQLNGRPPLKLEISYAKKTKNVTLKDANMNVSNNNSLQPQSVLKTFGRGQRFIEKDKFTPLKIQFDGTKRVTTYNPTQEESVPERPIPELIKNPNFLCLSCKKPGEFSCGICKLPYCSSKCQAEDWPHHKTICELFSDKKEKEVPCRQYKYDTGYMSECSNNSDCDKQTADNQATDPVTARGMTNKIKNAYSQVSTSFKSSEPPTSRQRAFHKGPQQLTSIKSNEIEDSTLPLNKNEKVYVCNFQSPSKLWLHLKTAKAILSEMEKRLNDVVDKSAVTCAVDDVCCTLQNGVFHRIKVIEITPNAITVEFIDYGGTASVNKDLVYHLPSTFKKYSAQAICCKLVDADGRENVKWNDEEFSSFHQYTQDKEFKMKAYRCYNNIYDVSLVNEEGVLLYSIAQSLMEDIKSETSLLKQVPSVWSNLKEGMEVTFVKVQYDNDRVWGVLEEGSGYNKCLTSTGHLLQNVVNETEVTNLSCKEGDVAVGFSIEFKTYYRCVILKRLRSSFLVRHIDFGNTEEITELRSVTPPLLQIQSHVVCCTKPESLSFETFEKLFEGTVKLSVKSVENSFIELCFTYEGGPVSLQCYPWDHRICTSTSTNSTTELSKSPNNKIQSNKNTPLSAVSSTSMPCKDQAKGNENKFCKSVEQISPVVRNELKPGGRIQTTPLRIMKDSISEKNLTVGVKYQMKTIMIKSPSEMYVRLIEDEKTIFSLCQQLNQYCTADTCPKYNPVKDEIVCCKYSEDNNWYRAQVYGKTPQNEFKVNFIDYGNEEIVSDVNIKPLPRKFACTKLAFCVSLFNVKPEDFKPKSMLNLLPKLVEELWIMEVKDASKPLKVMLFQGKKSLLEFINVKSKFLKSSLNFQKFSSGAVLEVVISHLDDEKFYFHPVKDLTAISDLQLKINSGENKLLSNKPEVNNIYCCYSVTDEKWYRACVQKEISPNTFRVNFIDFGNEEEVLSQHFKEISKELFSIPVYCISAVVDNVNNANLGPETPYSVEVIGDNAGILKVKFLNLPEDKHNVCLSSFKKLTIPNGINEVMFYHSENGVHYCQLKENAASCATMFEKLQTIELKPLITVPQIEEVVCAKRCDGFWCRASLESTSTSNYKVFFIDYGNSEIVSTESVMLLPDEFHKYPIFCIPVRIKNISQVNVDSVSAFSIKAVGFASDGTPFVEIVPKSMDLPNISSLKKECLPADKKVEVTLCHLENDIYYAHMSSSQESLATLELELKQAETFADLSGLPKVGDIICAKFEDGVWYRGSVKNICDDQKSCQVFFIDYGNSEVISFKELKILPSKLCSFPSLAVAMKFVSIEELKNQLQENLSVFVKVVDKSPENIQIVELVVPGSDAEFFSIETRVLPQSLTEVLISYKEGDVFYIQQTSDIESLHDMMNDLQVTASLKRISSPKVGQLLCTKFNDDGNFYRGLIKEKSGNGFKTFFVDFGNTDISADIFSLPSKYSCTLSFGIPVIISNEEKLSSPLNMGSLCKIKPTGQITDGIQVVRVCPPIKPLLLSSIKSSPLERGLLDVYFHSFDGQFYFVSKVADAAKLNEMESMLANFTGDEICHVPSVEEILLVECEKLWFRGCIKKINESLKKCFVFLIDTASTKTIPFSSLSYVPNNICSFPIFLNKVVLSPSDPLQTPISFGKCYTISILENSTDVPVFQVLQPCMVKSVERKTLPLNEARKVIFYHKENSSVFFLQDVNDATLVTEMQAEARKCASSKVISHNPIVGELLCAQSGADGDWYRCCIEDVISSNKYKIHYIDYGNSEVVSKENLRYLSNSLKMYPSFGIAVKFVNQQADTLELEKLYTVIAISEPVNNIQSVKIQLQEVVCKDKVCKEEDLSKVNKSVEKTSSEVMSSVNGPKPKLYKYDSYKYVSFSPGEQDVAIYSIAESDETCEIFCTPFIPDNMATNIRLTDELTEYCESRNCSSYNGDSLPEDGELVLAKFNEDQKWYRAVILNCSDPSYDIMFIDWGNYGKVPRDSLQRMESQFMSLKMQAPLCTLTGFKVLGSDCNNINEELEKFTVFCNPEPLKAVVTITPSEDITIEIPVITRHLVEKGLVAVE